MDHLGKMIRIRRESEEDLPQIRHVNEKAFGGTQEADLVDELRRSGADLVSLVAVRGGRIVGHILFSPATIEGQDQTVRGMGLAPMAVLPEFQRQGIGSALIHAAMEELKKANCLFVVVLGHPEYYPRFGFVPASRRGIRSEWEVPDEAFMILVLEDQGLQAVQGVAKYRPEFSISMLSS